MLKFKGTDIFGHDKPVQKFIILMVLLLIADFMGSLAYSLIFDKPINWSEKTFFAFLILLVTVSYFMSRLIAYRTHLFSRIENRDKLLVITFIVLSVLAITAAVFLA